VLYVPLAWIATRGLSARKSGCRREHRTARLAGL